MRILRKVILVIVGLLALANLFVVIVAVLMRNWTGLPGALLRVAIFGGLCVYLIRLDRRGPVPPAEGS